MVSAVENIHDFPTGTDQTVAITRMVVNSCDTPSGFLRIQSTGSYIPANNGLSFGPQVVEQKAAVGSGLNSGY